MRNKKFIWMIIGALIYISASLVDRLLLPIDDKLYIAIVMIALLLMLIGILKQGR